MSISCAFSKARLNCFGWLIFLLILYKYPNFLNLVPSMGYFSPWRHILSSSHWVKCYKLHINCRWLLFPIFKTLVEIHTLTFVRTPCNRHRASLTSALWFVFNRSRVRKFPANIWVYSIYHLSFFDCNLSVHYDPHFFSSLPLVLKRHFYFVYIQQTTINV